MSVDVRWKTDMGSRDAAEPFVRSCTDAAAAIRKVEFSTDSCPPPQKRSNLHPVWGRTGDLLFFLSWIQPIKPLLFFFFLLVRSDGSSHCLQPLQWNLGTLGPCCAITVLSRCAGVGADSWAVLCAVCRVWWPWGLTQGRWTWAVGWGGVSTLLSLPARCEALGSLLFS